MKKFNLLITLLLALTNAALGSVDFRFCYCEDFTGDYEMREALEDFAGYYGLNFDHQGEIRVNVNDEVDNKNAIAAALSENFFGANGTTERSIYAHLVLGKDVGSNPILNLSINIEKKFSLEGHPSSKEFDFWTIIFHELTHGMGYGEDRNHLGLSYIIDAIVLKGLKQDFLGELEEKGWLESCIQSDWETLQEKLNENIYDSYDAFKSNLAWHYARKAAGKDSDYTKEETQTYLNERGFSIEEYIEILESTEINKFIIDLLEYIALWYDGVRYQDNALRERAYLYRRLGIDFLVKEDEFTAPLNFLLCNDVDGEFDFPVNMSTKEIEKLTKSLRRAAKLFRKIEKYGSRQEFINIMYDNTSFSKHLVLSDGSYLWDRKTGNRQTEDPLETVFFRLDNQKNLPMAKQDGPQWIRDSSHVDNSINSLMNTNFRRGELKRELGEDVRSVFEQMNYRLLCPLPIECDFNHFRACDHSQEKEAYRPLDGTLIATLIEEQNLELESLKNEEDCKALNENKEYIEDYVVELKSDIKKIEDIINKLEVKYYKLYLLWFFSTSEEAKEIEAEIANLSNVLEKTKKVAEMLYEMCKTSEESLGVIKTKLESC